MHAPHQSLCLIDYDLQEKARSSYLIAEQPAPVPRLAHPDGCAVLRTVLVTVPRVSRSCENFRDRFDLHLLRPTGETAWKVRMTSCVAPAHPQLFKMGAVTPLCPFPHHMESARATSSKKNKFAPTASTHQCIKRVGLLISLWFHLFCGFGVRVQGVRLRI